MKHAFLLEEVGLSESEYLTCLNKAIQTGGGSESTSRSTNGPGLPGPLAMVRELKAQATSNKPQAASVKPQA